MARTHTGFVWVVFPWSLWAQPKGYYYWTEAYTRRHTFLDTIRMEVCEGYPIIEVGLGDSMKRHKAILSLASATYLSPELLKNYPHIRTGSPRPPQQHLLAPANLRITTLMEVQVGGLEFEGVDAFVADEGFAGLLKTCGADLVLGCNFISAAVWAFFPQKGIAIVASRKKSIPFPTRRAWLGRWKGKLWSPFLWQRFSFGAERVALHPEFSVGQPPALWIEASLYKQLKSKGIWLCEAEGACRALVSGMKEPMPVFPAMHLYNALRVVGAHQESILCDFLNRKIYLTEGP
ncbi:MAG: retropepsin-like domain-containing protein [Flavobacteriales bacterium]|nr:retropepsin-like domain-containing protein [Flavobacteriales bacterium]MCX7768825.1 retropepsin-like domain-containing protein [Flavobacteriales bacterium]MDW8410817.1 hypothetical protein [Flavobacteriales bacterium]